MDQSDQNYCLEKMPLECSPDIKAMERKNDTLFIESSGTDPYFIIPDFDSFKNKGEIRVTITITAPCDTFLQLFYIADNGFFDGYHSRSRWIKKGCNELAIFIKENNPITALRLDPGFNEGMYILDSFTVSNSSGRTDKKTKPDEVILHVGLHKTATTSIQNTLRSNASLLEKKGYLYPLCWPDHSGPVYSNFCDHPESYYANVYCRRASTEIKEMNRHYSTVFEEEIAAKDFSTLIISGEDISLLTEGNLVKLKEYLCEVLAKDIKIKILIYLRDPVTWSVSLLQQDIKSGSSYQDTFEYIKKVLSKLFEERINKFVKVFGKEAVDVVTFEEAITHKGGPVEHFLTRLGFVQADIEKFQILKTNESLSILAADMISYINEQIPMVISDKLNDKRTSEDCAPLFNIGGPKFDICKEDKKKLTAISINDRGWLKNNWGIEYLDIVPSMNAPSIEFNEELMKEIKIAYPKLAEPLQELILEYLHNQRVKSTSPAEQARLKKLIRELRQTQRDKLTEISEVLKVKEMKLAEYFELTQKLQDEIEKNKLEYMMVSQQKEDLNRQLIDMSASYQWISTSTYWSLTKPLRLLIDLIKKFFFNKKQ